MKKFAYIFVALFTVLVVTSCSKDEMGGTASESMAGQWYVSVDGVDENGEVIDGFEDFFYDGRQMILTYNTAANDGKELYVDDLNAIWEFKVRTQANVANGTFATEGAVANETYDGCDVTITGGKILPKAGRQNNGSPADSIVFWITFSDDTYTARYGHSGYRVSGIRYSGLAEND